MNTIDLWELALSGLCCLTAGAILLHGIKTKEAFVHTLTALAVLMQASFFLLLALNLPVLETPAMQLQLRDTMGRPAAAAAFLGISLILLNGDLLWAIQKRFPTSS